MYFSKITIRPSKTMAEIFLNLQSNDAYASHQLLWQLFPDKTTRDFIYRQEVAPNGLPVFFVLSQSCPVENSGILQVQTKVFAPRLSEGQSLAFQLRVNPTVCMTHNGRKKRHDVLMHTKQTMKGKGLSQQEIQAAMNKSAIAWLNQDERLDKWGIAMAVEPAIDAYTQHKSRKKTGQLIQFSSVDFQGILTVKNNRRFMDHYAQGFGRSKALGCGLMMIRAV